MKTNDYVKYITQTFVRYLEQPKEERVKKRLAKKEEKPPWTFRWFGMLPYALTHLWRQRK